LPKIFKNLILNQDVWKKTNQLRNSASYNNYIHNKKVIDIGAGSDPVSANADRFDINEGDANFM
jgi:hypothetical protein